ncbi:hypothetical protein [Methylobacterium nigriterrae]|uniref:hypothetical protein n=1 Tax=Methylobacterium nigriterrae TaxID=3127512 RepID=UPI003014031C
MAEATYLNENKSPQIKKALAECMAGARTAEIKARNYLKLSQGEQDDTIYEACRSMHRFYNALHEFFLEEQRAIAVLLNTREQGTSSEQSVAA